MSQEAPHQFHLIDGQQISDEIKQEIATSIKNVVEKQEKDGVTDVKKPGLALSLSEKERIHKPMFQ